MELFVPYRVRAFSTQKTDNYMESRNLLLARVEALEDTECKNDEGDTPLLEYTKEYLYQVKTMNWINTRVETEDDFDPADDFIEILDILVHKKANLNAQDCHFRTALILLASERASLKVVRYLVEAGASTLYISRSGYSCLEEAFCCKNMEIYRYLCEARRLECQRYDSKAKGNTSSDKKKRWTTFWRFF
jgi:hypothetical protein